MVTKIKIRVDRADGTFTEAETTMPVEISEDIMCRAMDWKNAYYTKPSVYEDYIKEEVEFKLKQK